MRASDDVLYRRDRISSSKYMENPRTRRVVLSSVCTRSTLPALQPAFWVQSHRLSSNRKLDLDRRSSKTIIVSPKNNPSLFVLRGKHRLIGVDVGRRGAISK